MKTENSPRDPLPERAPVGRLVLWGILAVALVIGIVLYFIYQRRTPSLL
jgi:cytochrome c-type biogenesis protein CcmH/NrfF